MTIKITDELFSANDPGKWKSFLLALAAIFGIFFGVYFSASLSLAKTSAFAEMNILFEMDIPRVIADMTDPQAIHYRTNTHPLYILMVNPAGAFLKELINSGTTAAIVINCFLAALNVVLALIFFCLSGQKLIDAVLLACLFGISASQLLLSSVPETASLAICSLLVTYLLFILALKRKALHLLLWIIAGIFSLGVTTTNLIQTTICFAVCAHEASKEAGIWYVCKQIVRFLGWVLLGSLILSLVQKVIYPTSNVFFLPQVYAEDVKYIGFLIFQFPIKVIVPLMQHFWVVNFIAPHPSIYLLPENQLPAITFIQSSTFSGAGWIAMILWISFFATRIIEVLFTKKIYRNNLQLIDRGQPILYGFLLCLMFNLAFHSFYGVTSQGKIEYFLYTGNFTFLVLGILAAYPFLSRTFLRILLLGLIIFAGINNFWILMEILHIYT